MTFNYFSFSQTFSDCINNNFRQFSCNRLQELSNELIEQIPKKRLYFVGEAHTYIANNDFQFSLILALHKNKVYTMISELPHATCFLFNQYLESGDESLLLKIKPSATYNLLCKIREYNQTLPSHERIKYYGVDYIDAKSDYDNLLMTLKIIRDKVSSESLYLDSFIDHYLQKKQLSYNDVVSINDTLQLYLTTNYQQYRKHYNNYYYDLLLMSTNIVGYKKNRDFSIFKSILTLNTILKESDPARENFLTFYGVGHIDNLGDMLFYRSESPFRGDVCKIGIVYIDCPSGWSWDTTAYKNSDGYYKLKKKNLKAIISFCKQKNIQLGYILNSKLNSKCSQITRDDLSSIVIFNNYGLRKMTSWKFD